MICSKFAYLWFQVPVKQLSHSKAWLNTYISIMCGLGTDLYFVSLDDILTLVCCSRVLRDSLNYMY